MGALPLCDDNEQNESNTAIPRSTIVEKREEKRCESPAESIRSSKCTYVCIYSGVNQLRSIRPFFHFFLLFLSFTEEANLTQKYDERGADLERKVAKLRVLTS